jgi:hypothetical protein
MQAAQDRKAWSFYRRPAQPPEIAITTRDLSILYELYVHRFMNTRQLRSLFGEAVDRRIKVLFRAGLIDRPRGTRFWRMREGGGSQPGICAITNRGAQALVAFEIIERNTRDFDELNRELTGLSSKVPHDLAMGDVRVAFQRVCGLGPNSPLQTAHVRSLTVPGYDEALSPDWACFAYDDLFFHELHTGSETQTRIASPQQSNLADKYERYQAYAHSKLCRAQFGVAGFRVLTVIMGGERMLENVCATAMSVTNGNGNNRFLAARHDELLDGDPFAIAWRNAAGEPVRLSRA